MAFDRKHYNEIKTFMDAQLKNVPWCAKVESPIEWVQGFLPLVSDCLSINDYEGAKAISDAIRDFLNSFLSDNEKIGHDKQLKLPKVKTIDVKGIICYIPPEQRPPVEL